MFFLFSLLLTTPSPPVYTAVVVDAITRQPLAGVTVREESDPAPAAALITDAAGRFQLDKQPIALHLNRLGYAPLVVRRAGRVASQPDTLRLLPQVFVLGEVAVRAPRAAVLSSTEPKGKSMARHLVPGQAVALYLAPPTTTLAGQASVLDQLRFFLASRVAEGQLRVRLVTAQPAPLHPGSQVQPGPVDLLPEPFTLTASQLAAFSRGRVSLDLSKYKLPLPAEGLFVIIECLATNPEDKFIAVTHTTTGRAKRQIVLGPDAANPATAHVVADEDLPSLEGQFAPGNFTMWSRHNSQKPWEHSGSANVRVELSVLTY